MSIVVSLPDFIDDMDSQNNDSRAYLNKTTGKTTLIQIEYLGMVEDGKDTRDLADWEQEHVKEAEEIVGTDNYMRLPDQYAINEYQIMTDFCYSVETKRFQDELLNNIHGTGRFQEVQRHHLPSRD